jgi:hypothetical protein
MQSVQVQHHIRRATDFLDGMHLTRNDKDFLNSSALLAIHSAVSYSDALRVGLGALTVSADDHRKAVDELERLLPVSRLIDRTGFAHLRGLISKKSLVAYGSQRLNDQDFLGLVTKAERFAKWANSVGKQLKIEGWRDDG